MEKDALLCLTLPCLGLEIRNASRPGAEVGWTNRRTFPPTPSSASASWRSDLDRCTIVSRVSFDVARALGFGVLQDRFLRRGEQEGCFDYCIFLRVVVVGGALTLSDDAVGTLDVLSSSGIRRSCPRADGQASSVLVTCVARKGGGAWNVCRNWQERILTRGRRDRMDVDAVVQQEDDGGMYNWRSAVAGSFLRPRDPCSSEF